VKWAWIAAACIGVFTMDFDPVSIDVDDLEEELEEAEEIEPPLAVKYFLTEPITEEIEDAN